MSGSREGYIYICLHTEVYVRGPGRDIHIYVFIPRYKYVRVQGGIYIYLSSFQGINMSGPGRDIHISVFIPRYKYVRSWEGYTYICLHTKV